MIYDRNQEVVIQNRFRILQEGWYRVERIDDSITLIVRPDFDWTPAIDKKSMRVRLASLRIKQPEPAGNDTGQAYALARLIKSGNVYLRFDRTRFESDLTPLAYVFEQDGRLVNADLVRVGVASAVNIPGNSNSLQRLIAQAEAMKSP